MRVLPPPEEFHQQIQRLRQPEVVAVGNLSLKDELIVQYNTTTLDKLFAAFQKEEKEKDPEQLVKTLESFFQENWALINGTALCYTALPDSAITHLLCDIAIYVAEQEKKSPIPVLMPTICTDHFASSKKNITVFNPTEILKTHVLGREGKYLIPLRSLTQLTLQSDLEKINNEYYDVDSHTDEMIYLSEDELSRLSEHSDAAKAVLDCKKQYVQLSTNADNLLGRLNKLIQLMVFNSSHGGIGTAEIAAKGGMIAVADFFDYYNQLPNAIKEKIPSAVQNEIEVLRSFTVPIQQKNASGELVFDDKGRPVMALKNAEIGSCLGTRSAELKKAIAGHETELLNLQLSDEIKQKFNEALEEKFKASVHHLKTLLDENKYEHGVDKLGITKQLIEALGVKFRLNSVEDLALFNHLSCNEIREILTLPNAATTIVTAIGSIENLVIFVINTNTEKLSILLAGIQSTLIRQIIKGSTDLSATLISLDSEKIKVVITALKDQFPALITTAYSFRSMLRDLTPEQRAAVYTALKDRLPTLITTAADFSNALRYLSPDQRTAVFTAFEDRLPTLITTMNDFRDVLRDLTPEQCTAVCTALEDRLPILIKTADDFQNVLYHLTPDQCTALITALEDRLPILIKTADDFWNVLRDLTREQCTAVTTAFKDKLPTLIKTADDFWNVLRDLTPGQCTAVCTALKDRLPALITTAYSFRSMLRDLAPKQRTAVFTAFEDQLPALITTARDFSNALRHLTPEQCTAVCTALNDRLPELITTADSFRSVLSDLTLEQCTAVFTAFEDRLPTLIKTVNDFRDVLYYLTPDQRTAVFTAFEDQLPALITTARDFSNALRHLTPEQCTAVCTALNDRLPELITTADSFRSVLSDLTLEQCTAVFT